VLECVALTAWRGSSRCLVLYYAVVSGRGTLRAFERDLAVYGITDDVLCAARRFA
jgi:hypothetical protein